MNFQENALSMVDSFLIVFRYRGLTDWRLHEQTIETRPMERDAVWDRKQEVKKQGKLPINFPMAVPYHNAYTDGHSTPQKNEWLCFVNRFSITQCSTIRLISSTKLYCASPLIYLSSVVIIETFISSFLLLIVFTEKSVSTYIHGKKVTAIAVHSTEDWGHIRDSLGVGLW